jgi:hypothetical protein
MRVIIEEFTSLATGSGSLQGRLNFALPDVGLRFLHVEVHKEDGKYRLQIEPQIEFTQAAHARPIVSLGGLSPDPQLAIP